MWNNLAKAILRYKTAILIIIGIITVFMAFQMKGLRMKYAYTPLMSETDSVYLRYLDFKKVFGEDATLTVVAFEDVDFVQLDKYKDLLVLQDTLKNVLGVKAVLSYANAITLEKDTAEKKFVARKIFNEDPTNQQQLDSMFAKVKEFGFYDQMLYNGDTCYVMAITCDPEVVNCKKRDIMVDDIENAVVKYADKYGITVHVSGLPYTRTRMMFMVRDELIIFAILSLVIVALIFMFFFKSIKTTLFAILIVGVGVVWTLAIMAMIGYELTMMSGMLPPLLIVIGIPNTIYLINKYHQEYSESKDKELSLFHVIAHVGKATFLTNLTTAIGFSTFMITGNNMLIEFGLIATIGIVIMFSLSVCMVPAIFSFLAPPDEKQLRHVDGKIVNKIIDKFVFVVDSERNRKFVYLGIVMIVCIAIYGISLIKNESYIVDDIPPENQLMVNLHYFEKEMGGIMPLEISIDTHKKRGLFNMDIVKKIEAIEDSCAYFNCLSKGISIADAIKIIRRAYYNGNNDFYSIPSKTELPFIASYLNANQLNDQQGAMSIMSQIMDSTYSRARIQMRIADVGTSRMIAVTDSIQKIIDFYFPPEKNTTDITGSSIIFTKGTLMLVDNLVQSLALAIFLIALCMVGLFANPKMVIISILPNFIPLLVTACIMGYFGVRLKSSTILVFNIAFGISVDNAIHFLTKFKHDLEHTNYDVHKSVMGSMHETGVSILYSALTLFCGFMMFCASQFGGTIALGLLVGLTLFVAMFTNLIFLPTLILSFKGIFKKKQLLAENQSTANE
ncbi:MAG: MMPL family transporter [Bacteroidales bacterium]|nr:MMPL family transporter [Bacteroidales bacterium]